jgi:hypothetical protein
VDVQIHVILTLAQVGGERSASRPGSLTTGERSPDTHGIEGWMGPRAGLDDVEKSTVWTSRDSNSDSSVFQPTASCNSDCAILTLHLPPPPKKVNCFLVTSTRFLQNKHPNTGCKPRLCNSFIHSFLDNLCRVRHLERFED